ncbi:MAG: leucine-rich repeat domain-containing protein [Candidatus Rhabdochlamydia sp.]
MNIQYQVQIFLEPLQSSYEENIFDEETNTIFQASVNQLKNYSSEFTLIDKAIQKISGEDVSSQDILEIFNDTIAGYREVINPLPVISCLQDLQELEKQLEDHSLKQFWDALWFDTIDKPKLETIVQKREWFEDEQNQSLLDAVTILGLQGCEMVRLSREIFKLRNLKELYLNNNLIEVLPESIKVWTQLEKLDLCDNKLTYLPHNGIKGLKNLKDLNISSNDLTRLPRSMGCLKSLEKFNVKENYLKELPKEIGQCTSLEILKVSSNELFQLPIDLKFLISLKKFSAADNKLKYTSEELQALGLTSWKQIEKVDLSQNYQDTTVEFLKTLWPSATTIMHSHFEES